MDEFQKSVMIALLPTSTEWCTIDLPHLTLVYAGEIGDGLTASDFNAMAKDASSLAMLAPPIALKVMGIEVFGDEKPVDVLRLAPTPEIQAMYNMVAEWDDNEFEFNPHVTIGPVGSRPEFPPMYLEFDRVLLAWGDEQLTFWLRR